MADFGRRLHSSAPCDEAGTPENPRLMERFIPLGLIEAGGVLPALPGAGKRGSKRSGALAAEPPPLLRRMNDDDDPGAVMDSRDGEEEEARLLTRGMDLLFSVLFMVLISLMVLFTGPTALCAAALRRAVAPPFKMDLGGGAVDDGIGSVFCAVEPARIRKPPRDEDGGAKNAILATEADESV